MRLIDADGLKNLIYEEYDDGRYGYIDAIDIDSQPTAYDADKVVEALEKQIPKKPEMRKIKGFDEYKGGWCQTCKALVDNFGHNDISYCWNCGQAIDWSEEE